MEKQWFCYIPRSALVSELEKKISRCLDIYLKVVKKAKTKMTGDCRIWKLEEFEMKAFNTIDKNYSNYTRATIDAIPINYNEI